MFSFISDQTFICQRLQWNLHQAELTQGRLDSRAVSPCIHDFCTASHKSVCSSVMAASMSVMRNAVAKQENATFEQELDANSALSDLDRGMAYIFL